ncbi:MAG: hypothetical protein EOM37_06250 [Proteobacteria bacterium]|jgi:DNA-nicking Smr family endonuclease|nr:Smr/MutS family protein [Alphaproteobacteria bacterium]NCC03632.1 hypothetical protein [Pseudomonadota bacterium]
MTKDNDEKEVWSHYIQNVKKLDQATSPARPLKKKKPFLHALVETAPEKEEPSEPKKSVEDQDSMEALLSQKGPTAAEIAEQIKKQKQKPLVEIAQSITPSVMVAPSQPLVPLPPKEASKEPLDLRIERNLSLGDVVIEARTDLHGHTEQEAHEKLVSFLQQAYQRGRRVVLVITGKGTNNGSVLRQNIPRWCDVSPLSQIVLAIRSAAAHHGGEGAYYIVLRKQERAKEKKHGL